MKSWVQVLETVSCKNEGKGCVLNTQSIGLPFLTVSYYQCNQSAHSFGSVTCSNKHSKFSRSYFFFKMVHEIVLVKLSLAFPCQERRKRCTSVECHASAKQLCNFPRTLRKRELHAPSCPFFSHSHAISVITSEMGTFPFPGSRRAVSRA
jgi:hypothetical protein